MSHKNKYKVIKLVSNETTKDADHHDSHLINTWGLTFVNRNLWITNKNGPSHISQYTHDGSLINTIDIFNSQMIQTPLQMQLLYYIYYWMNNVLPTHPPIPLLQSTKGKTQDPLIPPLLTLSAVGDIVEFLKTHLSSFLLDSSNVVKFCAVYPNYPLDQTSQGFFKNAIANVIITPLIDVSRTTVVFNELIQHLGTQKDYNLSHIVNYPSSFFAITDSITKIKTPLVMDKKPSTTNVNKSMILPLSTGIVINETKGFVVSDDLLPSHLAASFLMVSTETGFVISYSPLISSRAIIAIDNSFSKSVYKGLTIADNNLYLADFFNRRIDVYDFNFKHLPSRPFVDPLLPSNYSPYNIVSLDNYLYILYAEIDPQNRNTDKPGDGHGFISIFNTDGTFVKRFISKDHLNSPWSLMTAPNHFGKFSGQILVSNNGNGQITAYNSDGHYLGTLKGKKNKDIMIRGLRELKVNGNEVFFSAGFDKGGMIGKITEKD